MQTLIKIILFIFGFILCISAVLIPLTLMINYEFPELINEKKFLLIDLCIIIVVYSAGSAIYKLINPEKYENKN